MKFQRSLFAKVFLFIVLIGFNVIIYFNFDQWVLVVSLILSGTIGLVVIGVHYRITDNKLRKHFFIFKRYEMDLTDISIIEFYTEDKAGYIRINLASPNEDEYKIIFKNGNVVKIPSYYMNKKITVGEYLIKHYKIKKKETKKIKYIYGNP